MRNNALHQIDIIHCIGNCLMNLIHKLCEFCADRKVIKDSQNMISSLYFIQYISKFYCVLMKKWVHLIQIGRKFSMHLTRNCSAIACRILYIILLILNHGTLYNYMHIYITAITCMLSYVHR